MARKKSAAKKAKEAEILAKIEQEAILETANGSDSEIISNEKLKINNNYQSDNYKTNEDDSDDDMDSSSDSEIEDEFGELLNENVEEGINNVLNAIRNDDKSLLDPNVRFFEDPETATENLDGNERQKPVFLKDYQRESILSRANGDYNNEHGTIDGKKSFAAEQKEDQEKLIAEIKGDYNSEEEDEDFLVEKQEKRHIEPLALPNPDDDPEKFLNEFTNKKAWIPQKFDPNTGTPIYDEIEDEVDIDDDKEFDNEAERYETALNHRFEDPNSAQIVTYARGQASLRRSNTNSRKKEREKKREEKIQEKKKKEAEVSKLKKRKVNKVMENLNEIKKALVDEGIDEAKIIEVFGDELVNEDFDISNWDEYMGKLYDDDFYNGEDSIKKPTWEEDKAIDNLGDENEEDGEIEENKEEDKPKKSKKAEKREKKQKQHEIKNKVVSVVEKNIDKLIDEVEKNNNDNEEKFRYREVSPEAYGLTTREIFAADDVQLNELINLKKLAPYRDPEKKKKDKRKFTKRKIVRGWKKEVFNDEGGLDETVNPFEFVSTKNTQPKKKHRKH